MATVAPDSGTICADDDQESQAAYEGSSEVSVCERMS